MRIKAVLAIMALTWSTLCLAQSYPSKHITFVLPAPPGGATDAIARVLADEMGKSMGQTIIVENKPGGAGMLGAQAVARARPDGYTILVTHSAPLLNVPFMMPNVPYDVRRDFAFITQIATGTIVLAVNKDVPAKDMQEFLAWAAQNKGSVSYGSYGVGGFGHLASAFLDRSRGLNMIHVPYKGEAPMIQDLLGGQIHWGIGTVGALAPHLKTGRVRALAVLGEHRLKNLPDVPTMAEAA